MILEGIYFINNSRGDYTLIFDASIIGSSSLEIWGMEKLQKKDVT